MHDNNTSTTENSARFPAHPIMVLLVDDQPIIAESIRRMLQDEADIDLHYCTEGNDALALVANIHPTLILQDLIMPHVDGLDLVSRYRAKPESADIPIIVLTSKEDPKTKAEAFRRGANDYVVKLPDKLELVARIRYHSQWYIYKRQRDDAYRSLQESQKQLENANLRLMHLSTHDSLTSIPNRYHFDQVFSDEWNRMRRVKKSLSIIMIDIDFFKKYNDALGHQAGDECLIKVATCLSAGLNRPGDLIARYGGEEFALILPSTDIKGAQLIAEKVRASVEVLKIPHPDSSASACISISLGVASIVPNASKKTDDLLREADQALYDAKALGRNQVRVAGQ